MDSCWRVHVGWPWGASLPTWCGVRHWDRPTGSEWMMGDRRVASAPLRSVTGDEIEAFHRDGAVLIKNILPLAWVEVAEAGLDADHITEAALNTLGQRSKTSSSRAWRF